MCKFQILIQLKGGMIMGCLVFILFCIVIFALMMIAYMYAVGIIIAVDVISGIALLASVGSYINAKKMKPSTMQCPNCSNPNVKLSTIQTGGQRKRIANCQSCGFEYDYITPDDITQSKNKSIGLIAIFAIILAVGLTFTFRLLGSSSSSDSKSDAVVASTEEPASEKVKMDDFEYSIDGETISLERYNGDSEILEISPTMEVGGKTYNTDLSDFQVYSSSVKTLIIDEGITQIHTSIFNGSDVETLFFPKSLSQIYDYTLAYLHPDEGRKIQVYYAGTEEEWNSIFTEYTHMEEQDSGAEAVGQAAADFVNGLIGVEYDASLFEYHFSASIEDIK